MNVPDELREVRVALAKDRFVPALENVTDPAVPAIVILSIAGEHALHYPSHIVRLPLDKQVDMVRHQAVRVKVKRQTPLLLNEQTDEPREIVRAMKNVLSAHPARNQVIKPALDLQTHSPRHGEYATSKRCRIAILQV
jgi:hypothetical protein